MDHVAPQTRVRQHRPESRTARRFLRDVAVATGSLVVVALLAGYALAGPTPALETSLGPVVPQPGARAVVQGRVVEPDGEALAGARVDVRRAGRVAASTATDETGTFRVELTGPCASYRISLRATVQGSRLESTSRKHLCPGDALPVDARVITHGHFLWVPGPR